MRSLCRIMSGSSPDEEPPSLRSDTLAALASFFAERDAAVAAEAREADVHATGGALVTQEDWQLSQFWYDIKTGEMLAQEILTLAQAHRQARGGVGQVTVAVLSAPSAYKALLAAGPPEWLAHWLFEYDARFAAFGASFVHYDFNAPDVFPRQLTSCVDIIIMDPPFLNADTLRCFAATASLLRAGEEARLMLCTGAVMLTAARELLGVRPVRAHVGHANRLSNPFCLYVNYDEEGRLGGVDAEAEAAAERDSGPGGA